MKLKFDPNLEFQKEAIRSIVDVFDGQPLNNSQFEISFTTQMDHVQHTELGIGNKLILDHEQFFTNVKKIQEANQIPLINAFQDRHFSIEMETGTGKTYVYLRTLFELNQKYGFKKFIIVVPSVAIREGVLKNLDITKQHFSNIYNHVPFDYFVYDSKKISQLRQFATSDQIQILIINIDAFRKAVFEDERRGNIIHREHEKLSGRKPIEFVQATNPIVIIDEPQSVDNTPKSQEAIQTLNPLCTLRYSATHTNSYNLMYKLDPVKAYDLRLVKRIEVASVVSEGSYHNVFVKLNSVDNKNGIKAKITVHEDSPNGLKEKKITVKQNDDLSAKTQKQGYEDGFIVQEISCEPENEYIIFNSGQTLRLGESIGGMSDDILRVQIKNTVQEHFEKELKLKKLGIKVLSLFFVDRVANYRSYDDEGNPVKGKIALWFEECFNEVSKQDRFKGVIPFPLEKVHDGYFSQDKKGKLKDTNGDTQDDEDVYNKIMKNKEQLLSMDEPLRFIFSHSALREGWDNPNVFQICTLSETKSQLRKRQEIGRGLRLPVNMNGDRVFDESINRLTVIANESYDEFAKKLQNELEVDFGIKFGRVEEYAFSKITTVENEKETPLGTEKSKALWLELQDKGYIDAKGDIQPKFNPKEKGFELKLSSEFEDLKHEITDIMESHLFKNRIVNKKERKTLSVNKRVFTDPEFQILWDKINKKTTYSVEYTTNDLIAKAVAELKRMEKVEPVKIISTKVSINIDKAGVETTLLKAGGADLTGQKYLPDILAYIQKETELTRKTIVEILKKSGRLNDFFINPQKFMSRTAQIIKHSLNRMIVDGIKYEKIAGQEYEMRLFEQGEVVRYLNNLIEVKKSVYDMIEYESDVEKRFAEELELRTDIKLFVKLPSWFKVKTPVGTYNPDWAIVKHQDTTLYLVRETKATKDFEKLRNTESDRIHCGKKHFEALEGIDFKTVISAQEV